MVYLNRIYTRTGDDGTTGLGDGTRIPKSHPRVVAYGAIDELNSVIGLALVASLPPWLAEQLQGIQNDLFDLGADLCLPESDPPPEHTPLRATAAQTERLELWIDAANERLEPLTSFILPGGVPGAAHLHHARTVCRRAEIEVFKLAEFEAINPQVAMYLNRLSDLLFVLARVCNDDGTRDVLWTPGRFRDATERP
jgi:cob(I)alamin adenosyltransferase